MSEPFVDSSQADMLLDLLRANEAEPAEQEDPLGIDAAVSNVSGHFKDMIAALLGLRVTVNVSSVGLTDGTWLEPQSEEQGCACIANSDGDAFFYMGMRNEEARNLAGIFFKGIQGDASQNTEPLSKSEKKFLTLVADKLIQRIYTARDSLEAMPLPASARTCEPIQATDQVQAGRDFVEVGIDANCAGTAIHFTLLFALEVLQPATGTPMDLADGGEADDREEATAVHAAAKGGIDLGLVPSSAVCELVSTELSLAQIRRLTAGELLPVEVPIRNVRLLDADGNAFLSGPLRRGKTRMQMVASRMVGNTNGEVAG